MSGGNVELVLAPGMTMDADDNTPETLRIRLAGRMRHGQLDVRRQTPQ
ncbi:hypothetical protein [Nonomuraea sp. GTA35]